MPTVRGAAGVNIADVTRYVKERAEEKQAAGGQVVATLSVTLEQPASLAGPVCAEASSFANERHTATEKPSAGERN